MSYNGSGTFVINSAGQPVVTGTVISSTAFNALTADLATGLSTAITKDGQTTTTSRILFAQGISSTLVTDATSATTGSIISAGGISCQKALNVGTTGSFASNVKVTTTSATTDSFTNTDTNTGGKEWRFGATTVSGGYFAFYNATDAVFGPKFSSTGLVGIGMTPTNVLDITQTQDGASIIGFKNASTGTSGRVDLRLYNSSNLGILTLFGTGFTSANVLRSGGVLLQGDGSGGVTLNTGAAQPIYFGINNTEVARIDTSGNLLVGKTSDVNTSTGLALRATGESRYSVAGAASNTTMAFFRNGSAGESGSITTTSTTTSYVTSSDYRLKENVLPMTGGLATVAALKPVTYDWISNGSAGEGFIAHELQAVIPAAASGEKDAVNEDGSIKPQGVDFGKIVPHLVAAIQELTTRLAALENK